VNPVVYTNRDKLLGELDEWLDQPDALRLNAGELQDSLALDGIIPLVDDLVPRFAVQKRHKLLLVTKAINVRNLLKYDPNGQVIVAFSVNAPEVAEHYEIKVPHPLDRVKAAAKVKEAGYYVALRLDPMVPVERWQRMYADFIKEACEIIQPHQWTLGSIRHYGHVRGWARKVGRDTSIFEFAKEVSLEDRRSLVMRRAGETMRRIRRWTVLKLEYLDHYLQAYVNATKKTIFETYYIDAFAGPGDCFFVETGLRVDGSPWRALHAVPPFGNYWFIDSDADAANHLKERIRRAGIGNAHVFSGDCNNVLPKDVLPQLSRQAPGFAFLDPTGLQLHWATIEALAMHRSLSRWKM